MQLVTCLAAFLAFTTLAAAAADGDIDQDFGIAGISYVRADATIARTMRPTAGMDLPDGKLLFAGVREKLLPGSPVFEPEIRGMLVRLDADGMPDASFGSSGIPGLAVMPDLVSGLRVQGIEGFARFDDGSLIATGTGQVNGPFQGFVVKLTADGVVDTSFGTAGVVLFPLYHLHAIRIDALGRIVAAGERYDSSNAAYVATVLRLLANGEPDPSFGTDGLFSVTGADATASGYLNDVVLDPDGGIIAGGAFETDGSGLGIDFSLIKLTQKGELDAAFAGGGWRVFDDADGNSSKIERLVRMPDGSVAFAGFHPVGENRMGPILGRVTALGLTDTTFGDALTPGYLAPDVLPASAENTDATSLIAQSDGKLVASFGYFAAADREDFVAIRTSPSGTLDGNFADAGVFRFDASQGGVFSEIGALLMQPDGRLVVAGRAQTTTEILVDFAAVRLLTSSSDSIFTDSFDSVAP